MQRRMLNAVLAVLGTACTSVKSTDLETSGMSAHMTVTADGQGNTSAVAELTVDNNVLDFVDLSSGDSLVATTGGSSQSMGRSDLLGIISYSTTFSGNDAAGTGYTIALNRKSPDVSAPSSTCSIPQPFQVTAPSAGAAFSRLADAISVTYGGAGQSDVMSYQVSGPCVNTLDGTIAADPGSFTIASGMLVPSGSSPACTATLTVTRTRAGQLDHAYGYGGSIACAQSRSFTFTSNP
jgi:hypothetical protein